jgi:hypothetical protein
MKQTAVEWLFEKMTEQGTNPYWDMRFIQAKEMEKEQMRDTWLDSRTFDKGDNYFGKQKSFDEYYNETYKKK